MFLLCVEGLSTSLKNAAIDNLIQGCKISVVGPAITHLLFAYDSFVFFKATTEETRQIKDILQSYEVFSGQAVNYQKSAVFFSSNVQKDKQLEIKSLLGVSNDLGDSKYLSLPSLIGKSKKTLFRYLKDKVWQRIQCWNTRLLSRVGKEVLIRNLA